MMDSYSPVGGVLAVRAVEDSFKCSVPEPEGTWSWEVTARPSVSRRAATPRVLTQHRPGLRGRAAGRLHALADHLDPVPGTFGR